MSNIEDRKTGRAGNDRNQMQAPRTRNVAAHNFEEQHGSRKGRAYGTEPTKRKHQVKHAICSTPPSKKKCCSRSSRTWAHGNNKAQAPNKCNSAAHHFKKQCGISSGAWAHETMTHGNGNNAHPRAQERERGAQRTVTREDDGGSRRRRESFKREQSFSLLSRYDKLEWHVITKTPRTLCNNKIHIWIGRLQIVPRPEFHAPYACGPSLRM